MAVVFLEGADPPIANFPRGTAEMQAHNPLVLRPQHPEDKALDVQSKLIREDAFFRFHPVSSSSSPPPSFSC